MSKQAARAHILLVDDNYANRLIAQTILQREGHHVTLAENGLEAIRQTHIRIFDLIILDIQMPVMDGLEAYKHITNALNPNQFTPIMALSAYCSKEEVQLYHQTGFKIVLEKPLSADKLFYSWARLHQSEKQPEIHMQSKVPLLDDNTLTYLAQLASQESLINLCRAFESVTASHIRELDDILMHSDASHAEILGRLSNHAHALSSSSSNIGASRLQHIADQLKMTSHDHAPILFKQLKSTFLLSRKLLLARLLRYNYEYISGKRASTSQR